MQYHFSCLIGIAVTQIEAGSIPPKIKHTSHLHLFSCKAICEPGTDRIDMKHLEKVSKIKQFI